MGKYRFFKKNNCLATLFLLFSLVNLYGTGISAKEAINRGHHVVNSGANIGKDLGREWRTNEENAGGDVYGVYGGGVYLAPEQDIDPGQTEFDNSYYEALQHPPQVP